jgi:hypothetical protein
MKWFMRPGNLVLISVALAIGALALWLWPAQRDITRPVPAGDQEIAWLNPATGGVPWERFVAAVYRLQADRPDLAVAIAPDANPFPPRTTDVPELAISVRGRPSRLWFRWYKLTGDLGHRQWVEALARRSTPPLAVMGGGTSDRAYDLARELKEHIGVFAAPPPLIITSASSERIPDPARPESEWPVLMDVYPQRSFRFCFTNRQMAEAVIDFIWTQDDLRPDAKPVYAIKWDDDGYSRDLFQEFRNLVLSEDRFAQFSEGRQVGDALLKWEVPYSVGGFYRPNHWEEEAALTLVSYLELNPGQRRPLLIVPGAPQPARRFLRSLVSLSPATDRHYVVATGDYIDFNTIYRDRNIAWPIQDLPVTLVGFCQRNPVHAAAFRTEDPDDDAPPDPGGRTSTGTHDLLLYKDIVATLVDSVYGVEDTLIGGQRLCQSLATARLEDGAARFDVTGNLKGGAHEHVFCLRPVREGDRVMPLARLQVWTRQPLAGDNYQWTKVAIDGKPEWEVSYTSSLSEARP